MPFCVMKREISLSEDDIQVQQENALELFHSGIKSKATLLTYDRILNYFLNTVCKNLLAGDYQERAQEFVELARKDQQKAINILIAYIKELRKRTQCPREDPDYLNPSTIPNKVKPINKLLTINGVGLAWKRIHSFYPEKDNTNKGAGYTREQLQRLLEHSDGLQTDFIITAWSSGGFRVGSWENIKWKNIFPVYKVDQGYKIELDKKEKGTIVCAAMLIYPNTYGEYVALISLEAWHKLEQWKKLWTEKIGRTPLPSDPILLSHYGNLVPLTPSATKTKIAKLAVAAGIRGPLLEGRKRHLIPVTNGFRRYYDKIMMKKSNANLASLVIKERLLGHDGIVKTDKNYFWTDVLEHVDQYMAAMPELMLSDEYRLRMRLEQKEKEITGNKMIKLQYEEALTRIAELENKMERFQRYNIKSNRDQ